MPTQKQIGTCKLTKATGNYVNAHIIPLSVTRLSRTGEKYIETGIGLSMIKRANSWYDRSLVTRQGEKILAEIDSNAIKELRANRLIWSGWKGETTVNTEDVHVVDNKPLYRVIDINNPGILQIFFLSLLWRAAASDRPEFKDISLNSSTLEDLRVRVNSKDPGKFSDYPIFLFQIITLGVSHNRTPLLERREIPDSKTSPKECIDYVRFYFDGLITHVHLPNGQQLSHNFLNTSLGSQKETIVFIHTFEDSRANANIKEMVSTVHAENQ